MDQDMLSRGGLWLCSCSCSLSSQLSLVPGPLLAPAQFVPVHTCRVSSTVLRNAPQALSFVGIIPSQEQDFALVPVEFCRASVTHSSSLSL